MIYCWQFNLIKIVSDYVTRKCRQWYHSLWNCLTSDLFIIIFTTRFPHRISYQNSQVSKICNTMFKKTRYSIFFIHVCIYKLCIFYKTIHCDCWLVYTIVIFWCPQVLTLLCHYFAVYLMSGSFWWWKSLSWNHSMVVGNFVILA